MSSSTITQVTNHEHEASNHWARPLVTTAIVASPALKNLQLRIALYLKA